MSDELNRKQRSFVNEYVKRFNGTEAAIAAGYSKKSADSYASQLLSQPKVAEAVEARMREQAMSADEVLKRLSDIARGDVTKIADVDSGHPKLNWQKARSYGLTQYIKSWHYSETGQLVVELHDSKDALKTLAKYHKLLTDRLDVSGDVHVTHEHAESARDKLKQRTEQDDDE